MLLIYSFTYITTRIEGCIIFLYEFGEDKKIEMFTAILITTANAYIYHNQNGRVCQLKRKSLLENTYSAYSKVKGPQQ